MGIQLIRRVLCHYRREKEIAGCYVQVNLMLYPEKAHSSFQEGIRRAPDRGFRLTQAQTEIALLKMLLRHSKNSPRVDSNF